jgi:RNA polymerase sigma factor (sigma-70 family)
MDPPESNESDLVSWFEQYARESCGVAAVFAEARRRGCVLDRARDLAGECVQESLTEIWRLDQKGKLPVFDSVPAFRNYVTKAAINCLRRRFRGPRAFVVQWDESFDPPAVSDGEETAYSPSEVHNAVNRLPEEARKLIDLYFFEGLSIRDVAKQLGQSPTTAWRELGKAVKQVRELLTGVMGRCNP